MIRKKLFIKKLLSVICIGAVLFPMFSCGKEAEEPDYVLDLYCTNFSMSMSGASYASAASAQSSNASAANATSAAASVSTYNSSVNYYPDMDDTEYNTEEYSAIDENIFKDVSVSPLSTFSADVDTASYSNVRRMLYCGYNPEKIPQGSVRAEEMINYFPYDYKGPSHKEPFGINTEISTCPWNEEHKLVRLGIQTEEPDFSNTPASNIVFLIDVSGSMYPSNKLPLLVESLKMMLDNLDRNDKVSIVTYAHGVNVLLDGVKATNNNKTQIKNVLNNLTAEGSTNGEGGIIEAYDLAQKNFIKRGNNRVILASDGDFNVGASSQSELEELISEKAESGIFLSVLGFGMGNYSDTRMETLADKGNGNYAYIDTKNEAKKVLVEEFGGNMLTVAKDVKFQVEFNPYYVSEYRLIGYENRILNHEDFNDDQKDAGEIGAGQSVTVLYEIVPASENGELNQGLKYQKGSLTDAAKNSNEWLTLKIRYKEPDEDESKLLEYDFGKKNYTNKPSEDFIFCAAVAEYAMILRKSDYIGNGSAEHVRETLDGIKLKDDYRKEFSDLVDIYLNF